MKLHQLPKLTTKTSKRVGRGIGSGRGKTAGRGTKGQKARGKVPASFIGGTLPLYKKLPFKRGKGNAKLSSKPFPVKLSALKEFKAGSVVDINNLIQAAIIKEKDSRAGVKILADGEIKVPLTIVLPLSKKAAEKIKKAGGKIANG